MAQIFGLHLFYTEQSLNQRDGIYPGAPFVYTGPDVAHAVRSLRVQPGEHIIISDGTGHAIRLEVLEVAKGSGKVRSSTAPATDIAAGPALRGIIVEVISEQWPGTPSVDTLPPQITVAQALPKSDRLEAALAAMTEFGVDRIYPWQASRSISRASGDRADKVTQKWTATVREAAKQSRRLRIPQVGGLLSTADLVSLISSSERTQVFILHEKATTRLSAQEINPDTSEVLAIIGPEGGISDTELAQFSTAGGVPVLLGSTVLRTSTAGAAALAVLNLKLGRW